MLHLRDQYRDLPTPHPLYHSLRTSFKFLQLFMRDNEDATSPRLTPPNAPLALSRSFRPVCASAQSGQELPCPICRNTKSVDDGDSTGSGGGSVVEQDLLAGRGDRSSSALGFTHKTTIEHTSSISKGIAFPDAISTAKSELGGGHGKHSSEGEGDEDDGFHVDSLQDNRTITEINRIRTGGVTHEFRTNRKLTYEDRTSNGGRSLFYPVENFEHAHNFPTDGTDVTGHRRTRSGFTGYETNIKRIIRTDTNG
ncbi:hypothetical protein DPMN_058852 [Dreissena polymorpha]|uniref:Uncharacterized protein n=1 Tax=Dreissena polymorpha TaxID=45954 RepID=A0A9D4HFY3_DREPO|nr:hypothetical protein DPMN_058852 [Dreissena polymorpha]